LAKEYMPTVWPDQRHHHALAATMGNGEMKNALYDYQYPYTPEELMRDPNYSDSVKLQILAMDSVKSGYRNIELNPEFPTHEEMLMKAPRS